MANHREDSRGLRPLIYLTYVGATWLVISQRLHMGFWRFLLVLTIIWIIWVLGTFIYYRREKMPVGTITNNTSDKIPVNSAPPDGYVVVRRMTYGEELQRSAMVTSLTIGGNSKDMGGQMDLRTDKVALWDFAHLVVEHNFTDENGVPLNFKNERDVQRLDVVIGKEIGQIIDDFNTIQNTDEVKNS